MRTDGDQFRLRITEGDPELRCPKCGEWLPVTVEFWYPPRWWECRTCHAERQRLSHAIRMRDAEFREQNREKGRRYRKWLREHHPSLVPVWDRVRAARHRAWLRNYRKVA